jgi:hypothetical protein
MALFSLDSAKLRRVSGSRWLLIFWPAGSAWFLWRARRFGNGYHYRIWPLHLIIWPR